MKAYSVDLRAADQGSPREEIVKLLGVSRAAIAKKARCKASFFRSAGWVELLRFLTRDVHEPRHAKFVSKHAKRITPWGFLKWHCDGAAARKLLEIAL